VVSIKQNVSAYPEAIIRFTMFAIGDPQQKLCRTTTPTHTPVIPAQVARTTTLTVPYFILDSFYAL